MEAIDAGNSVHRDQAMIAKVYGLGVGPGDPELITLKALRLLTSAQILVYPAPQIGNSLVRAIAAPHLPGHQKELAIRIPMHAAQIELDRLYATAAQQILDYATSDYTVAILCQGDPFFYGSFIYLFAHLSRSVMVEVVPGITSLTTCSVTLGIPLVSHQEVLTVVPAGLPVDQLISRIQNTDTIAIVKVGQHFEKIRTILDSLGLSDHAHYIERASLANQKIIPFSCVIPDDVPYFSMILVSRRSITGS